MAQHYTGGRCHGVGHSSFVGLFILVRSTDTEVSSSLPSVFLLYFLWVDGLYFLEYTYLAKISEVFRIQTGLVVIRRIYLLNNYVICSSSSSLTV